MNARLISFNVQVNIEEIPAANGKPKVAAETRSIAYGVQPVGEDGKPAKNLGTGASLDDAFAVRVPNLAAEIAGYASDPKLGPVYAAKAAELMSQVEAALKWHMQLKLAKMGLAEVPDL